MKFSPPTNETEYRLQTTDYLFLRQPPTDYKTLNTKYRTAVGWSFLRQPPEPNTEYRLQNTEYRLQINSPTPQ